MREAWKYRGVAQLVARGIWDAEVADSSSVAPTIKSIWRMVDVWWNSLKADYILQDFTAYQQTRLDFTKLEW